MNDVADRVKTLFAQGCYTQVLKEAKDQNLETRPDLLPLMVGANVFLGFHEKAQVLTTQYGHLSAGSLVACRFFLGVGHTRRSNYDLARQTFARNALLAKSHDDPTSLFYIYQGLGFYRYFCGRLWLAARWAERAYKQAVVAKTPFGQIFSLDLLGHSQIQMGAVRSGLRSLNEALKMSEELGNGGIVTALKTSLLKYKAEHGINPQATLPALHAAMNELKHEYTYSKAELALELARQQILRGQLDAALFTLNQNCDDIYQHQNRRQSGLLNLRYSLILHLQGQSYQALNLLRATEQSIVPEVDHVLAAQMHGLKLKIFEKLKKENEKQVTLNELYRLDHLITHKVNSRILSRYGGQVAVTHKGEDPLGDLIDLVKQKDKRALHICLDQGYYGLLPDLYDIPVGERALIFDLTPGSVTLLSEGNVAFRDKGLNGQLRRFLLALKDRARSKQELVEEVWGYEYDPLRHDVLIYSAATKLRRILSPFGHWLEYSESGYLIRSDVKLIFAGPAPKAPAAPRPVKTTTQLHSFSDTDGLNHRQMQICEYLRENPFIGVKDCAEIFSISKITASRDLSHLHQLGICKRVGQARATRYCLKRP